VVVQAKLYLDQSWNTLKLIDERISNIHTVSFRTIEDNDTQIGKEFDSGYLKGQKYCHRFDKVGIWLLLQYYLFFFDCKVN
jgi:hypothetical protein